MKCIYLRFLRLQNLGPFNQIETKKNSEFFRASLLVGLTGRTWFPKQSFFCAGASVQRLRTIYDLDMSLRALMNDEILRHMGITCLIPSIWQVAGRQEYGLLFFIVVSRAQFCGVFFLSTVILPPLLLLTFLSFPRPKLGGRVITDHAISQKNRVDSNRWAGSELRLSTAASQLDEGTGPQRDFHFCYPQCSPMAITRYGRGSYDKIGNTRNQFRLIVSFDPIPCSEARVYLIICDIVSVSAIRSCDRSSVVSGAVRRVSERRSFSWKSNQLLLLVSF